MPFAEYDSLGETDINENTVVFNTCEYLILLLIKHLLPFIHGSRADFKILRIQRQCKFPLLTPVFKDFVDRMVTHKFNLSTPIMSEMSLGIFLSMYGGEVFIG